ncbi:hypothetical protein ES703_121679 [subsurface metagenome]
MKASKKRYDSKHKVTRIFLADYQLLKGWSRQAGISMAEALHRLIEHQAQLPLMTRVATKPAFEVVTQPAFPVSAPVALRVRSLPTIATNGSKVTAFRIKSKGVRYE